MARKRSRAPLNVYLNGRSVGRLTKATSGAIDFRYVQSWLDWEHAFPVSLSLPLREDRYIGEPVTAVFDNLLPDHDGIRRRLAERVGADGHDAYSLLAAIGRDCVGALQFLPDGREPGPVGVIDGEVADDERIAGVLATLDQAPLGLGRDEAFRISIAGAQEKTALLFWNDQWHVPHGTTATTHILKPQIGMRGDGIDLSRSVENEHFCMKLIAALGMPAAKTEIVDFANRRALAIERFDRVWTKDGRLLRVPQEDCCQALSVPPTRKYQSDGGPGIRELLELFKASDHPARDQTAVLKAQIIFWLLGATDGHAKNFSIFLHAGGGFELTPFYDVMSAQPNLDARQIRRNQMKLAMSVGDHRRYALHAIMPRHFVQTGRAARLPADTVESILDEVAALMPRAMDEVAAQLPNDFPQAIRDSIVAGVKQRMRLIEARST
jgi:serine/threonine-protein kinase HipA